MKGPHRRKGGFGSIRTHAIVGTLPNKVSAFAYWKFATEGCKCGSVHFPRTANQYATRLRIKPDPIHKPWPYRSESRLCGHHRRCTLSKSHANLRTVCACGVEDGCVWGRCTGCSEVLYQCDLIRYDDGCDSLFLSILESS